MTPSKAKYGGKFLKITSLVLTICCLFTTVPMSIFAADIETGINDKGKISYAEAIVEQGLGNFTGLSTNTYSGGNYSVAPVPSADNPSMLFEPSIAGGQFLFDVNLLCENAVIETSIRIDGTPCSLKRMFTLTDQSGDVIVFGNIEPSGKFTLFDGTPVCTIVPGQFYDFTYIIKGKTHTYDFKLNGKTIVINKPIPNTNFDSIQKLRFQISNIEPGEKPNEKVYVNYVRAYASDRVLTEEQLEEMTVMKRNVSESSGDRRLWSSPEEVSAAMKGNILLYIGNGKATVGDEVKNIDDANPNAKPFYLNGTTMVPLRFLSENLGSTVEYNDADRSINISKNGHIINFKIGEKEYTLDGASKTLPEAPLETEGRTYVPLRAISEGLGTKVFWDKVGYVGVGDTVDKFDMNTRIGRHIVYEASRPAIFEFAPPEKVVEDYKNNTDGVHPKIMLNSDRIAEMKQQIKTDEIMKSWYDVLLKNADTFVKAPLEKHEKTDNIRMTVIGQHATEKITTCALAFLLSGKAEYKDRAISEMLNVCAFPDWNPYHFLDTAEMCTGVGLGYDWLYHELTGEQRKTIEDAIVNLALKEVLRDYNDDPTRKRTWRWCHKYNDAEGKLVNGSYAQNWVVVCGAGVSIGALAVGDLYPEIMGEVISKTFPRIADLMFSYTPDGAVYEGANYWSYGTIHFGNLSSALSTTLGTDYGMFDLPCVGPLMKFYDAIVAPTGILNYDMAVEGSTPNSFQLLWTAKRLNSNEFADLYFSSNIDVKSQLPYVQSMLFYEPGMYNPEYKKQWINGYYRDYEVATMSTQGYGKGDMFVGFKGKGSNITQHDAGSFILDALGVRWSRDPGTTLEHYFTPAQMSTESYYRHRAEGHSTIVVNPQYGNNQNRFAYSLMEKTQWGATKNFAICDLTKSYEFLGAKSVRRGIMMDTVNQYVHVRDEVTSTKPMDFYWFMQIGAEVEAEVSSDGTSVVLSSKGRKFLAEILNKEDYKFYVTGALPLEESPHPTDMVSEGNAKRLNIHIEGQTAINLDIGLTPLVGDMTKSDYRPQSILPLDQWKVDDSAPEMPELTGIYANGELIEGFNSGTYAYEYDMFIEDGIPEYTATCGEGYEVEVIQPVDEGKGGALGRITVTDKNNKAAKRNYYIIIKLPKQYVVRVPSEGEVIPKKVFALDIPQEQNVPQHVLDGDMATRWASEIIGTAIDFDFGETVDISTIGLATFAGDKRTTKFSVSISDDGENWKQVFEGNTPGNTLDIVAYKIGAQKARYVRLQGFGNSDTSKWFSPTEITFFK